MTLPAPSNSGRRPDTRGGLLGYAMRQLNRHRNPGPTYDPFDNPCGEDEDCPAQNFCAADGQCSPVLSGPHGRPKPPPSASPSMGRSRGILQVAQVSGSSTGAQRWIPISQPTFYSSIEGKHVPVPTTRNAHTQRIVARMQRARGGILMPSLGKTRGGGAGSTPKAGTSGYRIAQCQMDPPEDF